MNAKTKDIVEAQRDLWLRRALDAGEAGRTEAAGAAPPSYSFIEALSSDSLSLIVEPKRATPQRGRLHDTFDVAEVARECEAGGAAAISIVTEPELSAGSLDDLAEARAACSLPLVARDFVVHAIQVRELRAAGADAIFLPMAAFVGVDGLEGDATLDAIVQTALGLAMDVVLSVQDEQELEAALETDADILNIDNRDDDGRIDVERTLDLLATVPVGTTVISESVASGEEVARLHRAGVDALLLDEGHIEQGLTTALAVFSDLTLD